MVLRPSPRVDYDEIAHLYDSQPHRDKEVDPDLLAFLDENHVRSASSLSILDLGCGTGNQLVANRKYLAGARLVGLDLFHGMLRRAIPKADDIFWVQGDNAAPPFPDNTFDFISNQYSFHHVRNKSAMIKAVFRILRPGGRFVMTNICPREMREAVLYKYFPAALGIDLKDFMPRDRIMVLMDQTGFINVDMNLNHISYEQDLREFLDDMRRRDACSQLMTISDVDYHAGLRQLEMEIDQAGNQRMMGRSHICFLTIRADKPC
jgi:ubiquinone/menaquinone biosynthesis C-methylase UbiE